MADYTNAPTVCVCAEPDIVFMAKPWGVVKVTCKRCKRRTDWYGSGKAAAAAWLKRVTRERKAIAAKGYSDED